MESESGMTATATAAGRKRKAGEDESESTTTSSQVKSRRVSAAEEEDSGSSARSESCSGESDGVLASCCSSNGGRDVVEDFVDLEENEVTDNLLSMSAVVAVDSGERRQMPIHPSDTVSDSDFAAETRKSKCALEIKMPSEEELEEFTAAAEKQLRKEFLDKYNYDIEKDLPMEGRFEWVPLQP